VTYRPVVIDLWCGFIRTGTYQYYLYCHQ